MRLDELSHINMGQSPVGESLNETEGTEFHQGKIYFGDLFLQHSPIKTNSPTKLANAGDILICVRAPVCVVNITDRKVCIGRGLAALTPKENVPVKFLFHLLRQNQPAIEQIATGSTFASITTDQLRAVELPAPNRATWLRIAGIIGCIIHCLLRSHQEVFAHHQEADGAIYILRVHPLLSGKLQRQVVYCAVRWSTPPQNVSSHGRATSQ